MPDRMHNLVSAVDRYLAAMDALEKTPPGSPLCAQRTAIVGQRLESLRAARQDVNIPVDPIEAVAPGAMNAEGGPPHG
jgi:hypothetical protein